MAVRHLGNEKDGFVEVGAPYDYKVGDIVFVRMGESAGEGMFIGRLKVGPEILVLMINGKSDIEALETNCAPTGRGFPAEGQSHRRKYLKDHPGTLI
jgi:hypothetical protein